MMTLDQLLPGTCGMVIHVNGTGHIRRRLMDMGIVSGVRIEAVRCAPLGDPVEYRLLGYDLALRKAEAAQVEIRAEGEQ